MQSIIDSDQSTIINFGRYFLGEQFFNYASENRIVSEVYDPTDIYYDGLEPNINLSNFLLSAVFITLLFVAIGWYVEISNWFQKPNQDDTEEWVSAYLQSGEEAEMTSTNKSDTDWLQKYKDHEERLIKSKTMWGLLFLAFSPARNSKRLF